MFVFWKVLQHFPKFYNSLKKPPHIRRISPTYVTQHANFRTLLKCFHIPTEANVCLLIEGNILYSFWSWEKLKKNVLYSSRVYWNYRREMGLSQYAGDEKCKHGMGTSSVPAVEEVTSCDIAGKRIATVCSDQKVVFVAKVVQQGTTVNVVSYYMTLLLLGAAIITKRLGLFAIGVVILLDSTRPHNANATRLLLQPFRWEILGHSVS